MRGGTLARTGITLPALLAGLLLCSVGCVGFVGPRNLSNDLADELNWNLDREMGVTVRRSGLWLARVAISADHDEDSEEVSAMLKGVRRVQVGVYEVESKRKGSQHGSLCAHPFVNWTEIVRVCDEDEEVVLLTPDPDTLRELIVLTREDDELVVVYMKGDLGSAFQDAIMIASQDADDEDSEPRPDCDRRDEESGELVACQDPVGARDALHDLTRGYSVSATTP